MLLNDATLDEIVREARMRGSDARAAREIALIEEIRRLRCESRPDSSVSLECSNPTCTNMATENRHGSPLCAGHARSQEVQEERRCLVFKLIFDGQDVDEASAEANRVLQGNVELRSQ